MGGQNFQQLGASEQSFQQLLSGRGQSFTLVLSISASDGPDGEHQERDLQLHLANSKTPAPA